MPTIPLSHGGASLWPGWLVSRPAPEPGPAGAEGTQLRVERDLVQRSLAGDGRAFASLVEPHLPMLHRIAMRASAGDHALAEDALQEALTLVYQRLERYTPGTSLRALLAAVAAQQARTLLRGEVRRRHREDAAEPPEGTPSPAAAVSALRLAERIRTALARLPRKQQEVAILRLDGGLDDAEIAQAVGSTAGAVRVHAHHAMKALRAELADAVAQRGDPA
ncbi:MAG: RNA polymerase sigma factor [Polyangiaceae bacterium]|nr:RNA polymerase sigma factor [Polyangiaceae bacterium]